jgi:hypothetical protein
VREAHLLEQLDLVLGGLDGADKRTEELAERESRVRALVQLNERHDVLESALPVE